MTKPRPYFHTHFACRHRRTKRNTTSDGNCLTCERAFANPKPMRSRKSCPNVTALLIDKVRSRLRAGDSRAEVQEKFGLSRTTVWRIASGKVKGRTHRENPIRRFKLRIPPVRPLPIVDTSGRSYELFPRRTA